jgi:hypothetical protein
MLHNNTLSFDKQPAAEPQLLTTTIEHMPAAEALMTPPRILLASVSSQPPQLALNGEFISREFEGDSEQNYQQFLDFLTSGQSRVYKELYDKLFGPAPEAQADFEEEDLESLFKHKFNLNKQQPFYAGGQDDSDDAAQCAKQFLNYFWQVASNFELTRAVHTANKQRHAEGLTKITHQLTQLIDIFRKEKPFKTNLSNYYKQVRGTEEGYKKDLAAYQGRNQAAHLDIQLISFQIPENFSDLDELLKNLQVIYQATTKVFAEDSGLDKETTLAKLNDIQKLNSDLVKYLRKKNQRLEALIKETTENLNASCLSFVTAETVHGKKHCYLSISSPQYNEALLSALCEGVDAYNANEFADKSAYVFHIIMQPASQNSQLLLQKILAHTQSPHPADPFKHCAEKSYIALLAKLSYEKDITITSICNVNFLPLSVVEVNRINSYNQTRMVELMIQNEVTTFCVIPACKNCKINKAGALIYIGAAAEYRTYISQKIRDEHSYLTLSSQSSSLLFTPTRRRIEKTSFISPMIGLHPPHNTPSPQQEQKPQARTSSTTLAFPSLSGM